MEISTIEKVWELQKRLEAFPLVSTPTNHRVWGGLYAREIFIAAGTIWIGRVHRKDHFFVVLEGSSTMTTDEGPRRLEGPEVLMVKAGSKRAGICHTDCRFITFHRTEFTDIDEVVEDLVEIEPNSLYDNLNGILPPKEDL